MFFSAVIGYACRSGMNTAEQIPRSARNDTLKRNCLVYTINKNVSNLRKSSTSLHPRPGNRVKQHLKCSFGLGAVLHSESEQHNLPFASSKAHDRGFALEAFGAVGVTGDQDVLGVVWIPGNHGALGFGARGGRLESERRVDKGCDFLRHTKPHRV